VTPSTHGRSRYEGKALFQLLLALGIPSLILFFSLTAVFAASETQVTPHQFRGLILASRIFSAIFFVVQLLCARYVQKLLKVQTSKIKGVLQYLAVLVLCLFISVTASIACQSFGYRVYLAAQR
jgi:uncharacterized membrane protein